MNKWWIAALLFTLTPALHADEPQTAVFAGGCFWCMQPPYDALDGVLATEVGYTGGHTPSPTYEQVIAGNTGHYEAVRITYDPQRIDYDALLDVFWRNIDPLDDGGQFCDRGAHYLSAIFVATEDEKQRAEASLERIAERFDDPVVTAILPATTFYRAEEGHQDYYLKNPLRYRFYRTSCGRDRRLNELWGAAP